MGSRRGDGGPSLQSCLHVLLDTWLTLRACLLCSAVAKLHKCADVAELPFVWPDMPPALPNA